MFVARGRSSVRRLPPLAASRPSSSSPPASRPSSTSPPASRPSSASPPASRISSLSPAASRRSSLSLASSVQPPAVATPPRMSLSAKHRCQMKVSKKQTFLAQRPLLPYSLKYTMKLQTRLPFLSLPFLKLVILFFSALYCKYCTVYNTRLFFVALVHRQYTKTKDILNKSFLIFKK